MLLLGLYNTKAHPLFGGMVPIRPPHSLTDDDVHVSSPCTSDAHSICSNGYPLESLDQQVNAPLKYTPESHCNETLLKPMSCHLDYSKH